MAVVTERVVRAADVVLMVVDGAHLSPTSCMQYMVRLTLLPSPLGREGLSGDDYNIAKWLRPLRKGLPLPPSLP